MPHKRRMLSSPQATFFSRWPCVTAIVYLIEYVRDILILSGHANWSTLCSATNGSFDDVRDAVSHLVAVGEARIDDNDVHFVATT